MTDDDIELIRNLSFVATLLEENGFHCSGVVRRAAQRLVEAPAPPEADACPVCGADLVQPKTGRRRKYCSDRCRKRGNAT